MNIIRRASIGDCPNDAAQTIARALQMEAADLPQGILPAGPEWRRMNDAARLMAIADLLRAECFRLVEKSQRLTVCIDPNDSVGTRD